MIKLNNFFELNKMEPKQASGFKKRDLKSALYLGPEEEKTNAKLLDLSTVSPNKYENENINPAHSSEFPPISRDYLSLIEEIKQKSTNSIFKGSKIFDDMMHIFENLQNFKKFDFEHFIIMNYLLLFHLQFKQALDYFNLLKFEIEKFESSRKSSETKLTANVLIPSLLKTFNKDYENMEIIKQVLLFLSTDLAFSSGFKEKTLQYLIYDVRIFNGGSRKEIFTEQLMEKNVNFFDQVLWHCKNTTLLKFYEYEEAIDSVIANFYYFIEKKKFVEVQRNGEPNEDLIINAKVLEYCFKSNLNAIIHYIMDTKQDILLLPSTILLSFNHMNYGHLKQHLNKRKLLKNLAEFNIITEIFKLKNDPNTFFDFLLFIYSLKSIEFKTMTSKFMYLEFRNMFSNEKEITSIIYHMNPLFIFIAFAQIFYQMSKNCDNFHYVFLDFAKKLLDRCKEFIDNYSDFDHLKPLVSNPYAPLNKSALDMIFEDTDFFFPFFTEERLSRIVRINLDNGIIFDFDLMAESMICKIIRENVDLPYVVLDQQNEDHIFPIESITKYKLHNILTVEEDESQNIFKIVYDLTKTSDSNSTKTEILQKPDHFYQRKVFFSSISLRVILDFLAFFALFIYILIFTRNYTSTNYFFLNVDPNYQNFLTGSNYTDPNMEALREQAVNNTYDDNALTILKINNPGSDYTCLEYLYNETNYSVQLTILLLQDCQNFNQVSSEYTSLNTNLKILFILLLIISGDIFLRKGYQHFILKLQCFGAMDILELLNMFVSFVILMIYSKYLPNTESPSQVFLPDNFVIFQDGLALLSLFFGFFMFFLWLKITLYVKFWGQFGFIIKTIELMVRETTVFMVIYFINIAAFCSVLYVIASDFVDFDTYMKGLRNLFGYSLGQFQFPTETSPLIQGFVSVIIIVFLVISNVVLLNLLIAILNNVFSDLSSRIDLENSYNYFMLQKQYFFDEIYGHLMFFPRSFNFFLTPIHLLAIFIAQKKFTRLFINVYFSIYFFFLLGVYIICAILGMPLAWIKILWLIYMNKYYEDSDQKMISVSTRSVHFFLWFFGGLPFLLMIIFKKDVPLFVKSAWNEMLMPTKPMLQFQKIMQKHILKFLNVFKKGENEEKKKNEEKKEEEGSDNFHQKEKVKHKALQKNLKDKILSKKNTINDKRKSRKYGEDFNEKDLKKMERVFGGVEYEEAIKIFSFSGFGTSIIK